MSTFKTRIVGPNGRSIVLEVSANISERGDAAYSNYEMVHMPVSLIAYRSSSSRTFGVAATLISRTPAEADHNANIIDIVRSWREPGFGTTGATPPILKIYAYSHRNIDGKSVVLRSYDWAFNNDVDYVYTSNQKMPIVGQLGLSFEEVYSAEEVTAGKWKTIVDDSNLSSQQVTVTGKRPPQEESFSYTINWLGEGRKDPLQTVIPASKVTSAMDLLTKNKITTPGVFAGVLARTAGNAILNSSAVKAVTKNLPLVLNNIFVSGAKVAITNVSVETAVAVSAVTQGTPAITTSFGRTEPLKNSPPVTGS